MYSLFRKQEAEGETEELQPETLERRRRPLSGRCSRLN
jgi:hypothetical protein